MTGETLSAPSADGYPAPSLRYQLLLRLKIANRPGNLGKITTAVGEMGADIGSIDIAEASPDLMVRDFRISCDDEAAARAVVARIGAIPGVEVVLASDRTFQLHRRGKIEVQNRVHIRTSAELAQVYTPGVARVSMQIYENPDAVWSLTIKANSVAIVTDGTAVLGLGDIGPAAALPVMEGKSMLFKTFADIDAWPICLDTKDPDEIVRIVRAIAPGFGAILLEDISAPRCFEIEERLRAELDIPVFHDDQHGTAVVVLAGLINSLKIVQKRPEDLKVVLLGVGAAGIACANTMMNFGVRHIIGFDRIGALHAGRTGMTPAQQQFAGVTNLERFEGSLAEALQGADMFLGVSGPRMLTPEMVGAMARDAIVMALANPEPEIMPDLIQDRARIIATGRSDYPNQINNVLCFPGLFRGAFDAGAKRFSEPMKLVAARAIAETIPENQLSEDYILPSVFNPEVAGRVAAAVAAEATRNGNVRAVGARIFI